MTGLRLCCRGHDWAWLCSHGGEGGAGRGGDWRRGWLHSYSGHNGHNVVLIMLDATNDITFFILLYTLLFYFILIL